MPKDNNMLRMVENCNQISETLKFARTTKITEIHVYKTIDLSKYYV